MSASSSQAPHSRLSLTWRVLALSSLLLLVLAGLFTWLGHANLTRQFEESRRESNQREAREIQLALQRSEASLQQIAALTAASPDLGPALANGAQAELIGSLSSQWPTLQLEAGIDEILVFDARGRQLAEWGEAQADRERPVQDWVRQVMETEYPLSALRCANDCRQYAAVPILVAGESVGMVVLSRSLADVTRQAQQVSGSDVALLITGAQEAEVASERYLTSWNGHLAALTHTSEYLPLLRKAAQMAMLSDILATPLRLQHDGRAYELSVVRMEADDSRRSTGFFLLAADITAQIRAIQQNTRNLLLVGIGGWLAAELLLLAILLRPMARLRRLAGVLPALAHGGFAEARSAIPVPRSRFEDEIDVLEGTTLALSDQLETLEREVTARGLQLAERVEELARERDFVGSLLDTARVFIVTQDDQGRITLVNDYALTTLAMQEERLLGRGFDDVFTPRSDNDPVDIPQEERSLVTADGRQRTIAWYHAPLASHSDSRAARISVGLDITERKLAEARLTWLAERDPLTELYNRRYFQEALGQVMRRGRCGAVLLLDLDHFKDVNELSGHHTGDRLLRMVADTLFQEFGHHGVIARLGGDEFAMLLEGADTRRAISIAKQITPLLDNTGLDAGGQRHRATSSLGIALFPAHGDNPADLMANADLAMYKAKESSSQRWHLLSTLERAKDELQERVYWVERIRQAIDEEGFELMVQPIVRLSDGDVRHYEVLLRMRGPKGALISPAHFIPVAERSGQIVQIDRWVLRQSLRALSRVQAQGISLAVNLSGQTLHDEGLKQFLMAELAATGADPHHLILEITETAAITDFSSARGVLQALRDLGCRTALDDFGVGFSSFHYLGELPVDFIKIDGAFIRTLNTNADSQVIVKAIADIAAGFGKLAIAEFVDQEVLIPLLTSYGISYGQGYHLGRPTPLAEAIPGVSHGDTTS
ncbi:EAL domain-containing protein [Halomonas sp. MCCC 1A17488]|uniref:EAL domain-containing protein n=1 Tax=Billgrantia sulfidoxydans TaxID=2733484 RepID=A0ABX7W977_9GAMM|nr:MULTISPECIES: EAL domain-containing protein [Halomonas]MCE8017777.1 EAL domain-containing protein [Halomonas sp. MCCC 1A17488]MCG3241110.1 EAL domain-containing protein [Halomonas sp. MCCC 1A17488]QPP48967.1 EAL domain-containing protein [Halomonas sp. SS10-MC5]QTP56282.1 EAL domain-containing protein [Halomonas sulfidoxydans]